MPHVNCRICKKQIPSNKRQHLISSPCNEEKPRDYEDKYSVCLPRDGFMCPTCHFTIWTMKKVSLKKICIKCLRNYQTVILTCFFVQPARNMTSNPMRGAETSNSVAAGSSVSNRPNPQSQHHSESDSSSISAYTPSQSSIAAPAFSQFTPPEAPDVDNSNNSNMETNSESG